jgi:hypothetical protein
MFHSLSGRTLKYLILFGRHGLCYTTVSDLRGIAKMGSTLVERSDIPGWTIDRGLDRLDEQLSRRRWRILQVVLPNGHSLGPLPPWVKSPNQFIYWISAALSLQGLQNYLCDLETVAKQTCDLELLRLARRYRSDKAPR